MNLIIMVQYLIVILLFTLNGIYLTLSINLKFWSINCFDTQKGYQMACVNMWNADLSDSTVVICPGKDLEKN
jgi:hypothetical protein